MGNILPTVMNGITRTSAPVYEDDKNIEFITVSDDMEAFFILERYFPGVGAAGYPSAEPNVWINGRPAPFREPGQPNSWMFPRPREFKK